MNTNRRTALIVGVAVALVLTLGFAVTHSRADTTSTSSYNDQAPSATGPAKSLNAIAHAAGASTSGNSTAGTSPATTPSSHDPGFPCRSNALSRKCP
ncbi:MAG: hypothetical protein JWP02_1712 [Acidimicrobiales bacterium]|nr:hypothetical protein [Acidimicrobiales bacterium]